MKRVFLSYSWDRDGELVNAIKRRLEEERSQFDLIDPLEFRADYEFASQIGLHIKRASIVIAFLTNTSPNLLYEVGMAIGAGKTVLIAGHDLESLPAELQRMPFVPVSGNVELDTTTLLDRLHGLQLEDQRPFLAAGTSKETLGTYFSDPEYFDSMPPREFEELVIDLLQKNGFEVDQPQQPIQYGIDVVLKSRRDDSMIVVEMKKFSRQSRVSIKDVMALFGAATLYKADKAALITSSSFTVAALEMAKSSKEPRLYLLTMEDLLQTADPSALFR
jgi:Holliday junction resolvase-like predicted endonuclease